MARTVWCDSDDGREAVMMLTDLGSGQVMAWCGGCMATWVVMAAQAVAPEPAQEPAGAADVNGAGAGEGEATQSTPRPKRRPRAAQNASPEPAPPPPAPPEFAPDRG